MKRFALLLSLVVAALLFVPANAQAKSKHKHHKHHHHHHNHGSYGSRYYSQPYYRSSYYRPVYYSSYGGYSPYRSSYYSPYRSNYYSPYRSNYYSNGYCSSYRRPSFRISFGFKGCRLILELWRGSVVHPRMMKPPISFLAFLFTALAGAAWAENVPERREWTVDGVAREALVAAPATAKSAAAPVVFAFHGHGGNMNQAARSFGYHNGWPEAIVVYMQGLNTPGRLTDPEGTKPGWQHDIGAQDDRDLKFFDAVLASLEKDYRVDGKRIYSTGHSNGGGFTYLLWAARGDRFAAVAPSAAVSGIRNLPNMKPKPVMHLAGEKDTLVKYEWQDRMMSALRKLNDCGEGQPDGEFCTLYPSKLNAPVVMYIHPGAHGFPAGAPAVIVKFFKKHAGVGK